MNTIWLDVTTIIGWHRPAVGVVRTEAECASHALELAAQGKSVKFCVFDFIDGYREVRGEEVQSALDRVFGARGVSSPVSPSVSPPPTVVVKQPLENRLKGYLLKASHKVPVRFRAHIFQFLQRRKSSFFDAIAGARLLRAAFKAFVNPELSRQMFNVAPLHAGVSVKKNPPFNRGDTYISLGLDWDKKDLSYLFSIKRESGFKVVLFCYDVIPVKLPHLCVGDVASKFANYFTNASWCADKIICISECSKRDLAALLFELGAPMPNMEVVKLGCHVDQTSEAIISAEVASIASKPFILFVSTIERRKNHETLYRAYTKLIDKGVKDLPLLVFVGMPGWGVSDFMLDLKLDPRTQKSIVLLNNVTDAELVTLYGGCWISAFPSLYEGWGLPVAESLAFGKYCIASDAASIPEVGGELLNYIDPWNVSAWADEIEFLLENPEVLRAKEKNIRDHYKAVSWKDTAAAVFNAADFDSV